MAGFFNAEVSAAVLIYTTLQSAQFIFVFITPIRTVPDYHTYYRGVDASILCNHMSPSFYLKLFCFTHLLLLARTICRRVCGASVMHFLLALIHVPEVQLSELKSVMNEEVLF